jgi:hypothetical protein
MASRRSWTVCSSPWRLPYQATVGRLVSSSALVGTPSIRAMKLPSTGSQPTRTVSSGSGLGTWYQTAILEASDHLPPRPPWQPSKIRWSGCWMVDPGSCRSPSRLWLAAGLLAAATAPATPEELADQQLVRARFAAALQSDPPSCSLGGPPCRARWPVSRRPPRRSLPCWRLAGCRRCHAVRLQSLACWGMRVRGSGCLRVGLPPGRHQPALGGHPPWSAFMGAGGRNMPQFPAHLCATRIPPLPLVLDSGPRLH